MVVARFNFLSTCQERATQSATYSYTNVICKLKKDRNRSNLLQSKKEKNKKANAQSKSFQPIPATVPSLSNTCFFACTHFRANCQIRTKRKVVF